MFVLREGNITTKSEPHLNWCRTGSSLFSLKFIFKLSLLSVNRSRYYSDFSDKLQNDILKGVVRYDFSFTRPAMIIIYIPPDDKREPEICERNWWFFSGLMRNEMHKVRNADSSTVLTFPEILHRHMMIMIRTKLNKAWHETLFHISPPPHEHAIFHVSFFCNIHK